MGDVVADAADRGRVEQVDRFRALGHPLRLQILELIRARGPLTATEVGRVVGESAANCSFHLRVLADCDFIEAAPDPDGRRHPWRAASVSLDVDPTTGSVQERAAARTAVHALRGADSALLRTWDDVEAGAPAGWRQASFEKSMQLRLTAAQLAELRDRWIAAVDAVAQLDPTDLGDSSEGARELIQLQLIGFPTRTDWT